MKIIPYYHPRVEENYKELLKFREKWIPTIKKLLDYLAILECTVDEHDVLERRIMGCRYYDGKVHGY